jgi:hypothetical protein
MKRLVFAILIVAAVPAIAGAKYSGGSGTSDNPYQIGSAADLLTLAADANDYNQSFILIADINLDPNLPGNSVFTTAVIARDTDNSNNSFEGVAFTGVFDGAGHKITKLTINTNGAENDYLGLFGNIDGGEVKNLGLENVSITGGLSSYSTYIGGLAGENYGTISNCFSTGNLEGKAYFLGGLAGGNDGNISDSCSAGTITGSNDSGLLGGLVGENYGTISNCFSTGNLEGKVYFIGGLVGGNDGSISNSYSTGAITGWDDSSSLGGLVGDNYGTVSNCSSTGAVTAGQYSYYLGGLAGDNYGIISNCFSTGDVAGSNESELLGGLTGDNYYGSIDNSYSMGAVNGGDGSSYLGGLAGDNYAGDISNCFSTGTVTSGAGSSYLGGLVGFESSGSIISCYFLVTSGPDNGLGTPLTDEEMKQQNNYVGWDFNDIWAICEGTNYPRLLWSILAADIICPDGVDIFDLAVLCEQWLVEKIPADVAPPGGDGIVNFADFAVFADQWAVTQDIYALLDFAEQWLKVGLPSHSADISPSPGGDGIVNFADLAVMADYWLQGF